MLLIVKQQVLLVAPFLGVCLQKIDGFDGSISNAINFSKHYFTNQVQFVYQKWIVTS